MRIVYITAGAAGMYCGSCLHDNTLVAELARQGHDALLVPTYTPLTTDEPDVSQKRMFFGGINVYLQQKFALFRLTPWFLDKALDARGLLKWVSRFAVNTRYEDLGELTLSMLRGEQGNQSKEVSKLLHWLTTEIKPEVVHLTAVLLSGMAPALKRTLKVPILVSLQGDDIFLDALTPSHRQQALAQIRANCDHIDGFLATSSFYADFMSDYLGIPRQRIDVVLPGLNLQGHGAERERSTPPYTIGYFARICPEKGLHQLVDAYCLLQQTPGAPPASLRVGGWLGANQIAYFESVKEKIRSTGLSDLFTHQDAPTHADKVQFFQSIDLLCVPTTFQEPKGLYVLEALANGVPVVQPRHGAFPELVEATGGGLLVSPGNVPELAETLRRLLEDVALRETLGSKGKDAVHRRFTSEVMAAETLEVYRKYLK